MTARTCQAGHHGALHARRHQHDPRGHEPARRLTPLDAQEERKDAAAGVTAGAMSRPALEVADIFRGHGAAWRQANAGHVSLDQLKVMIGDRALPHGGARRPCRALRGLRPHHHRLQQLPQPALPEVPGRRGAGVAGRARGRAAAGALLPRGVHAAGGDRRHRLPEQGRDLRSAVQGLVRDDARRSRPTRSTWAPASASPRYCTPGARP